MLDARKLLPDGTWYYKVLEHGPPDGAGRTLLHNLSIRQSSYDNMFCERANRFGLPRFVAVDGKVVCFEHREPFRDMLGDRLQAELAGQDRMFMTITKTGMPLRVLTHWMSFVNLTIRGTMIVQVETISGVFEVGIHLQEHRFGCHRHLQCLGLILGDLTVSRSRMMKWCSISISYLLIVWVHSIFVVIL